MDIPLPWKRGREKAKSENNRNYHWSEFSFYHHLVKSRFKKGIIYNLKSPYFHIISKRQKLPTLMQKQNKRKRREEIEIVGWAVTADR